MDSNRRAKVVEALARDSLQDKRRNMNELGLRMAGTMVQQILQHFNDKHHEFLGSPLTEAELLELLKEV